jgi:hypothetical protein
LRRYLTSVANHEIDRISGDRYIPGGILPISEGGHLIQEGSDNIDKAKHFLTLSFFTSEGMLHALNAFSSVIQLSSLTKEPGID